MPLALGARPVAALRGTDRHHLDPAQELGHRNVPGDVAPAHPVCIAHPLRFSPVVEDQGVEDRHAEFHECLGEGIGVTGRRERSRVDEPGDRSCKEGLYHLPVGPCPDLLIRDPEAEDREDIIILLEFLDQGILDGKVTVHPVRPGEEEPDADGVPGGIPREVSVGVIEDATRVRVVDPLPACLLWGGVGDVHPGHFGLDVADQVPDVLRPAVEEVGAHGGDDCERDGRGRPPGIGVAERYNRDALREAAEDFVPDRVVRGVDQDNV